MPRSSDLSQPDPFEGLTGKPFKSGILYELSFHGHPVTMVRPAKPDPYGPWIWRAEFFDAFPFVDDVLLEKGYAIAYINLSDRFGCPAAVKEMEAFRAFLVATFHLKARPVLFGFSRGGLYAVHYAARYPQHVSVLYLDAPVLDILSWPGGRGKSTGSPHDFDLCKAAYGLTDDTVADLAPIPEQQFEMLARHRIPVILVAGCADEIVPWEENGTRLAAFYHQQGLDHLIKVILKPGCGHHPHSLSDPTPIVQFILEHDTQMK